MRECSCRMCECSCGCSYFRHSASESWRELLSSNNSIGESWSQPLVDLSNGSTPAYHPHLWPHPIDGVKGFRDHPPGTFPSMYAVRCTPAAPCGMCQGDCDSDDDCKPGLKCYQRYNRPWRTLTTPSIWEKASHWYYGHSRGEFQYQGGPPIRSGWTVPNEQVPGCAAYGNGDASWTSWEGDGYGGWESRDDGFKTYFMDYCYASPTLTHRADPLYLRAGIWVLLTSPGNISICLQVNLSNSKPSGFTKSVRPI